MHEGGAGRGRLVEREPVLLVDQNVFDGAIAVGAQPLRPQTGGFEAIRAVDPAQRSEERRVGKECRL